MAAENSSDRKKPIGVFDSGLGGLTVLRELHRRLPCEDLIYFGDTARVPYGTKGEKTVRNFARQDAGFLASRGVKLVVVACNTASAFALDHLHEVCPVPVLGVIEPGVKTALGKTRGGNVGVIGTSGTIRSGRYQEGLEQGIAGLTGVKNDQIFAQECPLFVPLVEEGMLDHNVTRIVTEEYLAAFKEAEIDTLILGCTHYPLLKKVIGECMGPDVALVDSAEALAEAAELMLNEQGLLRAEVGRSGDMSFYLSDIPWKFAEVGSLCLGRPIGDVKSVSLEEMEKAGCL